VAPSRPQNVGLMNSVIESERLESEMRQDIEDIMVAEAEAVENQLVEEL